MISYMCGIVRKHCLETDFYTVFWKIEIGEEDVTDIVQKIRALIKEEYLPNKHQDK